MSAQKPEVALCKKCKKAIKSDKDKIKCAGQCGGLFHNAKECSVISTNALRYLKDYSNNLSYRCVSCCKEPQNQPLKQPNFTNGLDESMQLLEGQSTILNAVSTDLKALTRAVLDKDEYPDYRPDLAMLTQSVNKLIVKLNQMEGDIRAKLEDQLNIALDKINSKLTAINKITEFNSRIDDVLIKLELLNKPCDYNSLNLELVIADLSTKVDTVLRNQQTLTKETVPVSEQISYINSTQTSAVDVSAVIDKLLEVPKQSTLTSNRIDKPASAPRSESPAAAPESSAAAAESSAAATKPSTGSWRFINEGSKLVFKEVWKTKKNKVESSANNQNASKKSKPKNSNNNKKNKKDKNNGNNNGKQNNNRSNTYKKNPIDINNFDEVVKEFGNINCKYPNFVSGGLKNPAMPPNFHPLPPPSFENHTALHGYQSNPVSFIDPLAPPKVKITQNLSSNMAGENRYLLARFRDPKVYDKARYFLAFFSDKSGDVCYKGLTKLNIMMALKAEGLPTNYDELHYLYFKYHLLNEGFNAEDVESDLAALRKHITKERTNFLQVSSENYKKFYYPSHKKFF